MKMFNNSYYIQIGEDSVITSDVSIDNAVSSLNEDLWSPITAKQLRRKDTGKRNSRKFITYISGIL